MKKNSESMVVFDITINDEIYRINYPTNELRRLLNEAAEKKEGFKFEIPIKGETYSFTCKVEDIMKWVKMSELRKSIVPKKLEGYVIDVTQNLSTKNVLKIEGRDEEIEKIWSCLTKKQNSNAILVGPTDVGKTATAYEIARQISTNECPKEFSKSRVIMINTSELLGIESEFLYKTKLDQLKKFIVTNKEDIIVFVDKLLHMKFDVKLIQLLHEMLITHNVKFISTSSNEDFDRYFMEDNFINKHLNEIEIIEPEPEELFDLIKPRALMLQKNYKVKISKKMLRFAISTASLSNSVSSEPGNVLNVLDRAFSEAKRKGKKTVDKECILSCYNSYLKLYKNTSLEQKKIIAYHEAGHYILFKKCKNLSDIKVEFVSILPMLDFLGVNRFHTVLGKELNYTAEYFEDFIAVDLGGRVGESKITNKFSTGASADLDSASECAKRMIMIYGLSSNEKNQNRSYLRNYCYLNDSLFTEKKKELIDEEIQQIIEKGFKKAEETINSNLQLLERIANELVEKEILSDEELEEICKEYEK